MALEKLSIRLGMHHGLYIGICIGIVLTATIILFFCSILHGGVFHIMIACLALLCSAILTIGVICKMENKEFASSDKICTCRYRSSLHTLCSQCALKEQKETHNDQIEI